MSPTERVLDWLIDDGQHIAELPALLEALFERLTTAVPCERISFGFTVLHPNYRVQAGTWSPEAGLDLTQLGFDVLDSASFIGSPFQAVINSGKPLRLRVADPAGHARFTILADLLADGYVDYIALPLIARGDVVAVFTFATRRPDGFGEAGAGALMRIMRATSPLISLIRAERIASDLMATYVGPATGARVLAGQVRLGDAESIEAVLWLCDLRGFTALTRELGAEAMVPLVNAFFDAMATPLAHYGGEVLKFIGDAMLGFFPSEGTEGPGSAASRAVTAAIEALDGLEVLSEARTDAGLPPLHSGIALHFGEVLYGNIGTRDRLDFTVFGEAVNRVARVEGLCAELGESLLMTTEVAARAGRAVSSRGHHMLKGLSEPIEVFALD